MKRIASILLLLILLFNFVGYRFFSTYLEQKADDQLEAKLDNNDYDDAQLISLKVPITHLSYYNNNSQFERVDGKIELNGIEYKFVKRRFFKDSVELLCIPNQTAMNLRSAKDAFFKLVNDLEHNGQGKKTNPHSTSKNFSIDNYTLSKSFEFNCISIVLSKQNQSVFSSSLAFCYFPKLEQPPDIC